MRTFAAFVAIAAMSGGLVCAAELKTPANLIGRWSAVKMETQGQSMPLDDIRLELEFTPNQMHLRMYTTSEARPAMPTHIFDCAFSTVDGRMVFGLRSASDSPGPETEIHHRGIIDVSGDELRLCVGHSDDPKKPGQLPKDFVSSAEDKNDLLVFRRVQANR